MDVASDGKAATGRDRRIVAPMRTSNVSLKYASGNWSSFGDAFAARIVRAESPRD